MRTEVSSLGTFMRWSLHLHMSQCAEGHSKQDSGSISTCEGTKSFRRDEILPLCIVCANAVVLIFSTTVSLSLAAARAGSVITAPPPPMRMLCNVGARASDAHAFFRDLVIFQHR